MGPMESNADVLGHVFATGSDLDAARESAERAIEAIELVTGPAPTD
jgi:hypothetical protein